jgi:hypothetical protein
MRVDLGVDSSGDKRWAELAELDDLPSKVSYKVQEDVLALYKEGELHNGVIDTIMHDLMISKVVTAWSFGDPPDGDPEKVRDLPRGAYRKLVEAVQPYVEDLDFMREGERVRQMLIQPSPEPGDSSG